MKLLIFLLLTGLVCCNYQVKEPKKENIVDTSDQHNIITPIIPANYEIIYYDRIVAVSSGIFPKGAYGRGAIEILIDTSATIEKFEIISAKIYIGKEKIYDYIIERETPQTIQLTNLLKKVVESVKIRKLADSTLNKSEAYLLPIKFQ